MRRRLPLALFFLGAGVFLDSAISLPSRVNGGGSTLKPVSGFSVALCSSQPGQRRAS